MSLNYSHNQVLYFYSLSRTSYVSIVCCLFLMFLLSGCSTAKKIQHLPQLLTIKHYADSKAQIEKDVEKQDRLFDELIQEIGNDPFRYETADQIEERFGSPIFKRQKESHGKMLVEWLYRYQKVFDGDKVYMYFDEQGKLVNLEYVKQKGLVSSI